MPIRPTERDRYPKEWPAVSARIRKLSGGQCECEGECGLHQDAVDEWTGEYRAGPWRCRERHGEAAQWARGLVVLTVAHLNHQPEDCRDENLKAMCQRCHNRYDQKHRQQNARRTRRAAKRNGGTVLMRARGKVDANQAAIVDALRKTGWKVRSLASVGRGMPDILAAKLNTVRLIEVKAPEGRAHAAAGEVRGR